MRKLPVKFVIETHLRILDSELIKLLKGCGLKGVKVGIESSDTEVMKEEKRFTISQDKQLSKIRELESNKIQISDHYIKKHTKTVPSTSRLTVKYLGGK